MLGEEFTHYGWYFGVLPVYLGGLIKDQEGNFTVEDPYGLRVSTRNWVPEFVMDTVEFIDRLLRPLSSEVASPFYVTGEIKRK